MKQALICLTLFTSFFCGSAQSVSKDTLVESEFSLVQRTAWDSIETVWYQKQFNPFLKKNKIKISCSGCERVTILVYFEIQEDGHCHPKILSGRKCEADFTKAQKAELEKRLMLFEFSPEFYNKNIKVYLGRALKC